MVTSILLSNFEQIKIIKVNPWGYQEIYINFIALVNDKRSAIMSKDPEFINSIVKNVNTNLAMAVGKFSYVDDNDHLISIDNSTIKEILDEEAIKNATWEGKISIKNSLKGAIA